MKNAFELVELIRPRPALYLGCKRITLMQPYLYGYCHAVDDSAFDLPETNPPFSRFNAWVAAKFDWHEHTAGWCRIILKESGDDDAAALDRFFDLMAEFQIARLIPNNPLAEVTRAHNAPLARMTK